MSISQARLKELLDYEPETGLFRWIKSPSSRAKIGGIAGNGSGKNGYLCTGIDGQSYYNHRLAFLYMNGALPIEAVDHIDGDRSNNKWVNLREATAFQNQQNRKLPRNNTSGLKGAYKSTKGATWFAQIESNGDRQYLGSFPSKESAHAAYRAAA